jgi:hypothetical protein
MNVCYLRDDNEIDVERCRISLRNKSSVTLFTLDSAGRVACLTGVVQSIQFDPNLAGGRRWRVEICGLARTESGPANSAICAASARANQIASEERSVPDAPNGPARYPLAAHILPKPSGGYPAGCTGR